MKSTAMRLIAQGQGLVDRNEACRVYSNLEAYRERVMRMRDFVRITLDGMPSLDMNTSMVLEVDSIYGKMSAVMLLISKQWCLSDHSLLITKGGEVKKILV